MCFCFKAIARSASSEKKVHVDSNEKSEIERQTESIRKERNRTTSTKTLEKEIDYI